VSDLDFLARSSLLAGLAARELEAAAALMRPCAFAPGELLCSAGGPGERCWILTAGLVRVLGGEGSEEVVARHRKGASVGEVAAILGEAYAETVVASTPTRALELRAEDVRELTRRHPRILANALATVQGRLTRARSRGGEGELGETVALAADDALRQGILAAARMATPRPVTGLDRRFSFAGAVTAADDLVHAHATVLLAAELDPAEVEAHLREADRVVALVTSAADAERLGRLRSAPGTHAEAEVVLAGAEADAASRRWDAGVPLRVVRRCAGLENGSLPPAELAWLGRHVTGTKLGLALGAGGAKGYAHVGVLQVLEEAGYVVDCVAGSSVGAIVASLLALGDDAAGIEQAMRSAFDAGAVAEVFRTTLGGRGGGLEVMLALLREITRERTFADTTIPLTVMAVDLDTRGPAPLRSGPLWEALAAATALAGVFPPRERDGHRLVDGLALVPVPTAALQDDGADVTIAVNLIGREVLPSWPGDPPPEPPPERRRRGVLDNLLEVMDLSQLAESARNAELADVVVTPRFGPGEWRDFHLADQFLDAGRGAAEAALPALSGLALPTGGVRQTKTRGGRP
jgi:predicted acylesterase/phospholipase RssA/CRP-like cAMP-binding protein